MVGDSQIRYRRQGGRDHGETQQAAHAAFQRPQISPHGLHVANNLPCPFKHPLALGREPPKPRGALNQRHVQRLFQSANPGGKGGLGDTATLSRAPKMRLPRQSQEVSELINHANTASDESPEPVMDLNLTHLDIHHDLSVLVMASIIHQSVMISKVFKDAGLWDALYIRHARYCKKFLIIEPTEFDCSRKNFINSYRQKSNANISCGRLYPFIKK